jgi:hypothetical protein
VAGFTGSGAAITCITAFGEISHAARAAVPRDNQGESRIASSRNAPERVGHCLTRMLPGSGLLCQSGTRSIAFRYCVTDECARRGASGCAVMVRPWRGVAPSGLDRAIPRIRRARHASLPTHLSSEQLVRLLQRPAAPGPAAYRDRAILSLLAGLGLRAGEVGWPKAAR